MQPRICNICKGIAIKRASACLGSLYDDALKAIGLNAISYAMMTEIRHRPQSMERLCEAVAIDRRSLSHILRPLMRDGFVTLEADGLDGKIIVLTEDGGAKLSEAGSVWRDAIGSVASTAQAAIDFVRTNDRLSSCPKRALFGFTY